LHRTDAESILQVVGLLGDLVGHRHNLTLHVARTTEVQSLDIRKREVQIRPPPGVFEDPLPHLVGETQPGVGVSPLQQIDHPHALVVVLERTGAVEGLVRQTDLGHRPDRISRSTVSPV
jgi:hypothetical protein